MVIRDTECVYWDQVSLKKQYFKPPKISPLGETWFLMPYLECSLCMLLHGGLSDGSDVTVMEKSSVKVTTVKMKKIVWPDWKQIQYQQYFFRHIFLYSILCTWSFYNCFACMFLYAHHMFSFVQFLCWYVFFFVFESGAWGQTWLRTVPPWTRVNP